METKNGNLRDLIKHWNEQGRPDVALFGNDDGTYGITDAREYLTERAKKDDPLLVIDKSGLNRKNPNKQAELIWGLMCEFQRQVIQERKNGKCTGKPWVVLAK